LHWKGGRGVWVATSVRGCVVSAVLTAGQLKTVGVDASGVEDAKLGGSVRAVVVFGGVVVCGGGADGGVLLC